MKVFIVIESIHYEGADNVAAFDTFEKAEKFMDEFAAKSLEWNQYRKVGKRYRGRGQELYISEIEVQ